ncbi:MAG: hypothetical protein WB579_11795 [Bryobacteraceae bacterium]
MDEVLKSEIAEIVSLVRTIPDNLQSRAFEMLLEDFLDSRHREKAPKEKTPGPGQDASQGAETSATSGSVGSMSLPLRLKAFLKKYELKVEHLDKLFHVEGGVVEPIWSQEEVKHSKAQIEITLMEALKHAMEAGEFIFDAENVRSICEGKKAYDRTNFKANFKNNSRLFAAFKDDYPAALSDEGMRRLAEMVRAKSGLE